METPYLQYLHDKYRFPRSLVHRPIQRFFAGALAQAAPGTRVLDAGCGDGIESGPWATRLCVTGVDYQRAYVAHCARAFPAASWVRADLRRLPFAGASFDLVVMNQVIEHLEEPREVVAELARALAPGGCLLVATPNFGGVGWPLVERTYHRWFVRDFDAEENHVTHYRHENLRADLSTDLAVESVATVCAGLILVGTARKLEVPSGRAA